MIDTVYSSRFGQPIGLYLMFSAMTAEVTKAVTTCQLTILSNPVGHAGN